MSLRVLNLFTEATKDLPQKFLQLLSANFEAIRARSDAQPVITTTFVDATSAAVTKYLPDGTANPEMRYYFQKVDSSANAVTVQAYGSQLIIGSATYVLAAQYDRATFVWVPAIAGWVIL